MICLPLVNVRFWRKADIPIYPYFGLASRTPSPFSPAETSQRLFHRCDSAHPRINYRFEGLRLLRLGVVARNVAFSVHHYIPPDMPGHDGMGYVVIFPIYGSPRYRPASSMP